MSDDSAAKEKRLRELKVDDENVFVRLPLVQWQQTKGRVAQLEDALRFWVERSDRFEEVLPPELDYMKARGVLNESYVVGRDVLSEKK